MTTASAVEELRGRVLVVQDDAGRRAALRAHLQSEGWAVTESGLDGAVASMTAGRLPAVVLLDLDGPGGPAAALQTLVELQNAGDGWTVPVLTLSARAAAADVLQAVRAGASDYLVTPLTGTELAERMAAATERFHRAERLISSERELRLLANNMIDVVLRYDESGTIRYVSQSVLPALGWDPDDVVGRPITEFLYDDPDFPSPPLAVPDIGETEVVTRQILKGDGSPVWVENTVKRVQLIDGPGSEIQTTVRDVSGRMADHWALVDSERRFRLGFEQCTIGMITFDLDGRVTRANPAYCALIGYPAEVIVGRIAEETVHPDDRDLRQQQIASLVAGAQDSYRAERRLIRADGSVIWVLVDTAAIRDERGNLGYFFVQMQDITERKETQFALEWQAWHDSLTRLPNRLTLERHLTEALAKADAEGTLVALLFVDIDRFKVVNDQLGHHVGDQLLVMAGQKLQSRVDPGDLVARFGGDEFVVVRDTVAGEDEAISLAERIIGAEDDEPVEIGASHLYLDFSCGVALLDGSYTAQEALRDADAAMYLAKERGRNRIEVFDDDLRRKVVNRFGVEQQLRRALKEGEIRVVYQPIVTISDGQMVGMEALVRWQHPTRGLLPPSEFILAAEESGLIVGIGEFVLGEALQQVVAWRAQLPGASDLWVSVNISSRQLAPDDPVALCTSALSATGAPPDALRLEITESAIMVDLKGAACHLGELRDLGVSVSVDDFGTGHSSLAYLTTLPVSSLKIDRSFLARLTEGGPEATIVEAITTLASGLDLEVCAEGVETEAQLAALRRLDCRLGQGYYWAKPLTPRQFEAWAATRN